MMRRPVLLALALLALAACDPVAPDGPPCDPACEPADGGVPTGTWAVASAVESILYVAAADGRYPDFSAPGEGGIVVQGAVEDTLRFTRPFEEIPGGGRGTAIAFADAPFGPGAEPALVLDLASRRDSEAALTTAGGDRVFSWATTGNLPDPRLPEPSAGRVAFAEPRTLTAADGATVTVDGALTFATQPAAAGDTLLLVGRALPPEGARYVIADDGTVVRTGPCGEARGAIEGTPEQGTITFTFEDGNACAIGVPERMQYRAEAGGLVLTSVVEKERWEVHALRRFEASYGVPAPSGHEVRREEALARASGG